MNHYQRLGVAKNADLATIKQAYRQKIAHQHPDRQGDDDGAVWLNIAYETLKDPDKRAKYDQSLSIFATPLVSDEIRQSAYQAGRKLGKFWQKAQTAWQKSQAQICQIDLQTAYCGGVAYLVKSSLHAHIPAGVTQGDVLQVPTKAGVAWVKIVLNDPTVDGVDVHYRVSVAPHLAKTGGVVELPSPFCLKLNLPKNLAYPATIILSGRGIPAFLGRQAGDLHLTFYLLNDD